MHFLFVFDNPPALHRIHVLPCSMNVLVFTSLFVTQNSPQHGHQLVAHLTGKVSSREGQNLSRCAAKVTSLDLGIEGESGFSSHKPAHSPGFPSLLERPWACWSQQEGVEFQWNLWCCNTTSSPASTLCTALDAPFPKPGMEISAAWFRNISQIPPPAEAFPPHRCSCLQVLLHFLNQLCSPLGTSGTYAPSG